MKMLKLIAALGVGVLVSACAQMPDTASRNAPFEQTGPKLAFKAPAEAETPRAATVPSFRVVQAGINVPRTLTVNEANSYYPRGDIVWRGDPIGDRYAQVEAIFEAAIVKGTGDIQGAVPVVLDIQVMRFHSLSEKARFSTGGVHNMPFRLRVRHAETGEILMPTRDIEADLPAYGGSQAWMAESQGQTQKVRVTAFLAHVIRQELQTLAPQQSGPKLAHLQPRRF